MARWWRRRSDQDFRDEIDSHLALEAERLAALHHLAPDDARYAARRAFGNVGHAQERFFESQRWAWADRLARHLRYALRSLWRRPGFSLAVVSTLGVGIGFNTAIFTIFYALTARAFPVRHADRVVNVYQQFSGRYSRGVDGTEALVSYPEYLDYRRIIDSAPRGGAVASAAVYRDADFAFAETRSGGLHAQYVSCDYFQVLETHFARGRGFAADECARRGEAAVVVLAHATWMRDFGGDSTVIGRLVHINKVPFTVIGVAEHGFRGLMIQGADAWLPITMHPVLDRGFARDSMLALDWSWLTMVARLRPGAGMDAARAQLAVSAGRRDRLHIGRKTEVIVAKGALLNFPEVRQRGALGVVLLTVLGALVMVMVSANIMNLLVARGMARRREIGIRLAIGASRGRLIEQLLMECGVLAALGGALGFALAYLMPPLVPRLVPLRDMQIDVSPDGRVLAFTLAVSIATALLFGLLPALQATRLDLLSATKGGLARGAGPGRPSRLRSFLVGVQVAGSALLLIVASLFVRAVRYGATIDPGYATADVVAFSLNLSLLGYTPDRSAHVYRTLRERLTATPGVAAVAFASPLPLLGRRSDTVSPLDRPDVTIDDVAMVTASGSYLETLRIPLLAGRSFHDGEIAAGATDLVVVSHSLATLLWPNSPAVGKRLRMGNRRLTVVGVAADTRPVTLEATTPFLYLSGRAGHDDNLRIVVRMNGQLASLERAVPVWAHEIDPAIVVGSERMSERVARSLAPARLASSVAASMGVLTTLLALIGIYGVVSFAVSQRTRDIAVRLALGATQRGVVGLMMREGSGPVLFGLGAGTLAALAASRMIRRVLLGVSPLDPGSYVAAVVLLLVTSLAAIYAPARRAARVNPARMLREE